MKVISKTPINGVGEVKFSPADHPEKLVRCDLEVNERRDGANVKVKKTFKLLRDNCPKELKKPGRYSVRLSSTPGKAREMLSFFPADGRFLCEFDNFLAREGEEPTFETHQGEHGAWHTFIAFIKIVEEEWQGLIVPVFLAYNFTEDEESGNAAYSKSLSRSEPTRYLREFFVAIGVDAEDVHIPYSDNILPATQKVAKKLKKQFYVSITDGRVASFSLPVEEGTEDWSEPEQSESSDEVTESTDFEEDEIWETE